MNGSRVDAHNKRESDNISMSTQSKKMPLLDLKVYVRVVAAVFSLIYMFLCPPAALCIIGTISSATAFVMALLRILKPNLFYLDDLDGSDIAFHYMVSGLMIVSSAIGFLNSCVVLNRGSAHNCGRNITTWLLLDSLFETTRVVYVFMCEIVIKGRGPLQIYELLISIAQYLLDSFLYCQMILRH